MDSRYEAVIGLEVHAQLATRSKIFSTAPVAFGAGPNELVNEVCAGLPGALPVLNRHAVTLAIRAGLALGCTVHRHSVFARKNYFYPDLPKGYQISQYDEPICTGGEVAFELDGELHHVELTRIHMEEDAGKSLHDGAVGYSRIDLNRAGTPLIEIVTEPVIRSPEEAAAYFRELRAILVAIGVNDGNMAEGSLRCDANISIRPRGQQTLGTRVEIKNLNSFKFLRDALRYEILRQIEVVEAGGEVVQETRLWNESERHTWSMRRKEGEADYRYFPDPDLPALVIDEGWLEDVRRSLPELPSQVRARLQTEYGLPGNDASVLADNEGFVPLVDQAVAAGCEARAAANWVCGALAAAVNQGALRWSQEDAAFCSESERRVDGVILAELQGLVDAATINLTQARQVFERLVERGGSPREIVAQEGMQQTTDTAELDALIDAVFEEMPGEAAALKSGKKKLIGVFVGQIMRRSRGSANPKLVKERLLARIQETK